MANTENIEAKLCAYVDGELDAAGRAEIEAHLVANPQHRALMQELAEQRNLLRDLPRATAPADLLENVHNQLERSALLGDDDRPEIAGRISAWPKVMSVAAVLAMAIGLFAVIYYILPQNSGPPREYATNVLDPTTAPDEEEMDEPAETAMTDATSKDKDLERERKLEGGLDAVAIAPASPAAPAPAVTMPADETAKADVFAKGGADIGALKNAGKTYTNIFADADAEATLKRSNAVAGDSLVMVVCSTDPSQAQGDVQKYLESNKIRWEPISEPAPQWDLKESQVMTGSRLGSTSMRLKGGVLPGAAADQAEKPELKLHQKQMESQPTQDRAFEQKKEAAREARQEVALAPAGTPPPAASTPNIASNAVQEPAFDLSITAPTQQSQQRDARSPEGLTLQQQNDGQMQTVQSQAGQSRLIVARGLTRRQLNELNDNLSTQNAGQVFNYRRSGENFTPTTLPAIINGAGGELAMVQTAAPPSAPPLATTTQPATPRRDAVLSDAAKTVDDLAGQKLPTTAPAKPAETDALAKTLAEASTGAASQPSTMPAAVPTVAPSVAATSAPTTQLAVAGPPTRPSADERLDVFICIQHPAPVAGVGQILNTAPTSQSAEVPAPNAATTAPSTTAPAEAR